MSALEVLLQSCVFIIFVCNLSSQESWTFQPLHWALSQGVSSWNASSWVSLELPGCPWRLRLALFACCAFNFLYIATMQRWLASRSRTKGEKKALKYPFFVLIAACNDSGFRPSPYRAPQVSYNHQTLLSQCNMGCSCSIKHWDPVCSANGMTYASPCLAGCQTSTGSGKKMVSRQLVILTWKNERSAHASTREA